MMIGMIAVSLRLLTTPSDRKRCEWIVVMLTFTYPLAYLISSACTWAAEIRPLKYDAYLLWIDGVLGFYPSYEMGRIVRGHRWLELLSGGIYNSTVVWPTAIFATYLYLKSPTEALRTLKVFTFAAICAFPFYLVFPAASPAVAFPGFPYALPSASLNLMWLKGPSNCVPSVHFTSALLVLWYARHWILGKVLGIVAVTFTIISTLGFGQHYAIDLVVAVPYAAWMYRMFGKSKRNAFHSHAYVVVRPLSESP